MAESDFSTYMDDIVNHTVIGHGLDLGKKTGLFRIMMNADKPKTSDEIASSGNLKERYVREWLNLMVCGKILDYEKTDKTYFLPLNKRSVLKPGGNQNLGFLGPMLSFLQAQSHVEECFKIDGPKGVPMSIYENFKFHHHSHEHDTMSFEKVKEILDKFPDLLTNLENGTTIFEGGCGSGILAARVASGFPKSQLFGVDISDKAINKAKARVAEQGLSNTNFEVADLSQLSRLQDSQFEFAYSHYVIHDVARASLALKEIFRVLKPGGVYLMVDVNMHTDVSDNINDPSAAITYAAGLNFAIPISLAEDGGEGLGPAWGIEKMQDYFKTAGFENVHLPCEPEKRNAYVIGSKPK